MPLPIPLLAPVTSATLPDRSNDTFRSSCVVCAASAALLHADDVLGLAIEGGGLLRIHPHELPALHLEEGETRCRRLAGDVAPADHAVSVERVERAGCGEEVGAGQ